MRQRRRGWCARDRGRRVEVAPLTRRAGEGRESPNSPAIGRSVYSAYEKTQIRELKRGLPHLAEGLSALSHWLVDLRPIAEKFYYHPSQEGSWSIKKLLPAITGHGYEALGGIKDGGMVMDAYVEAIKCRYVGGDERADRA